MLKLSAGQVYNFKAHGWPVDHCTAIVKRYNVEATNVKEKETEWQRQKVRVDLSVEQSRRRGFDL